jgi:hypothetical protein
MHGLMTDEALTFVELQDEGVDVWRPVMATVEGAGVYRLPTEQPADETWAFAPGAVVRCEARVLEGTEQLVAVSFSDARQWMDG